MGRIKEWNELFERSIIAEDFFAVMMEPLWEDDEEAVYVRGRTLFENAPVEKIVGRSAKKEKAVRYAEADFANEAEEQMGFLSEQRRYLSEQLEKREELFEASKMQQDFDNYKEDTAFFVAEIKAWETYGEKSGAENYPGFEKVKGYEAEFFEESDMKLTYERTGQILDCAKRTDGDKKKQDIRIEMVNDKGHSEEATMDEMLEEMTARLCAMMAKGTDGIYL